MTRRAITVKDLSREVGADLDEVLVTLWDLGLDYVLNPTDVIKSADVQRVRREFGVATRINICHEVKETTGILGRKRKATLRTASSLQS